MHRPADLLVKQSVLGEALDIGVRPEGELSHHRRAHIEVQHLPQKCLAGAS